MQQTAPAPAPEAGAVGRQRKSLVPYLAVTLLLLGSLYAGLRAAAWFSELGWRSPVAQSSTRVVQWRRAMYDQERDPALGMQMGALQFKTVAGKKLSLGANQGMRTAVLFVGEANGCSTKSLMATWANLQKDFAGLRVVVIASQLEPDMKEICHRPQSNLQVVLDPKNELAETFNARWKPRAYILDEGGRFTYVQPDTTLDPLAPIDARRVLERM